MNSQESEREAFEAWANSQWPNSARPDNAWIGWQARAALAPSPGIDAAEPWKEYAQHLEWCRTCAEDSVGTCAEGVNLKTAASAAPPAAQPSAEQQPVAWLQQNINRPTWFEIAGANDKAVTKDWTDAFPVFRHPASAQPDAAWLAEAERLTKRLRNASIKAGYGDGNMADVDECQRNLLSHMEGRA